MESTEIESLRFDGAVAVVTGAGNGLGRAYALELARRGARVVVNDLGTTTRGVPTGESSADVVVEAIRAAGGEAIANRDSVAERAGAIRVVDAAVAEWGRLDVLVSNAGFQRDVRIEDMQEQDFDAVLDVHLRGPFFLIQAAYRAMLQGGGGRIVVATSTSGTLGCRTQANYASAKAGVIGLVRTIALEGAEHGIYVNAISPGALTRGSQTDKTAGRFEGRKPPKYPELQERLVPERVAPLVAALCHTSCRYTGEVFLAWGGFFGRAAWGVSKGLLAEGMLSAEDIARDWAKIRGEGEIQSEVTCDGFDVVMELLEDRWTRQRDRRA